MKKIGITGQNGFVGRHLYNTLNLSPELFELIDFDKEYFNDEIKLDQFVSKCDTIVHLAAMNRHDSEQYIYETNIGLTKRLVDSLKRSNSTAHVLFSSSTQEERENLYGKSKKESRELLNDWARNYGGKFTGLLIPNVFGAFGKPFYNSFIATFCYQLTHGEEPTVANDGEVKLIYVQELVNLIIDKIEEVSNHPLSVIEPTSSMKVSEVLHLLEGFRDKYFLKGEIPSLKDKFEHDLFNTYRSYIDYKQHFPVLLKLNEDNRGSFVEIIRLGVGGQSSFSTTVAGMVRGNHFHTRKIERFAVIKGKALIQLRKIDTNEVLDFYLDGKNPSYVDMPIWYTHNIKNIGDEDLYTIFWIDEPFNPNDSDTYFQTV